MSNGLSQAEIDALLRGEAVPGVEDTPVAPPAAEDPNRIMSPEEIAEAYGKAREAADGVPPEDPMKPMSREEIDSALAAVGMDAQDTGPDGGALTPMEIDAMGEIGNISMGTSATTLFALLNRKVEITTPRVSITTMAEVAKTYPLPFVAVEVRYTVGLKGTNILFLRENDVKIITDLMLGGDGSDVSGDFNEMHISCISEVMNQMMGSASTSLSQMLGTPIDISPPQAYQVNLADKSQHPFSQMEEVIVKISFDMVVDGLINSEIMQVTPIAFAREMVKTLMEGGGMASGREEAPASAATPATPVSKTSAAPAAPAQNPQQAPRGNPFAASEHAPPLGEGAPPYPPYPYPPQYPYPDLQGGGYPPMQYGYPPYPQQAARPSQQQVDVRAVQFNSFESSPDPKEVSENMDLLMDVPLQVSVELGKSRKYIKEILDFNVGTIVVLDKMAGELVDVVVNGKLIARGEVVVIEESYGCRITDIVSPSKRINTDK